VLAVGTEKGKVLIWDADKMKQVKEFGGHTMRVGTIAWGNPILATGSRDKNIIFRDIRAERSIIAEKKGNFFFCGFHSLST
jgi:cell division cycle 20-like protein 1 (cofactor of APC complex)